LEYGHVAAAPEGRTDPADFTRTVNDEADNEPDNLATSAEYPPATYGA
jgi:hypothetical protein